MKSIIKKITTIGLLSFASLQSHAITPEHLADTLTAINELAQTITANLSQYCNGLNGEALQTMIRQTIESFNTALNTPEDHPALEALWSNAFVLLDQIQNQPLLAPHAQNLVSLLAKIQVLAARFQREGLGIGNGAAPMIAPIGNHNAFTWFQWARTVALGVGITLIVQQLMTPDTGTSPNADFFFTKPLPIGDGSYNDDEDTQTPGVLAIGDGQS